MNEEMTCQTAYALIEQQLDAPEPLPEKTLVSLNTHLHTCRSCQAYYQQSQQLITQLRSLPFIDPPADLSDRIMARIEQQTTTQENFPETLSTTASSTVSKIWHQRWIRVSVSSVAAGVALLFIASSQLIPLPFSTPFSQANTSWNKLSDQWDQDLTQQQLADAQTDSIDHTILISNENSSTDSVSGLVGF